MSLSGRTVKLLADNSRAGQGRAGQGNSRSMQGNAGQFQVNAGQFHDNAGQFQGNIILLKIKKQSKKSFKKSLYDFLFIFGVVEK